MGEGRAGRAVGEQVEEQVEEPGALDRPNFGQSGAPGRISPAPSWIRTAPEVAGVLVHMFQGE